MDSPSLKDRRDERRPGHDARERERRDGRRDEGRGERADGDFFFFFGGRGVLFSFCEFFLVCGVCLFIMSFVC